MVCCDVFCPLVQTNFAEPSFPALAVSPFVTVFPSSAKCFRFCRSEAERVFSSFSVFRALFTMFFLAQSPAASNAQSVALAPRPVAIFRLFRCFLAEVTSRRCAACSACTHAASSAARDEFQRAAPKRTLPAQGPPRRTRVENIKGNIAVLRVLEDSIIVSTQIWYPCYPILHWIDRRKRCQSSKHLLTKKGIPNKTLYILDEGCGLTLTVVTIYNVGTASSLRVQATL